ncbi:hypothetical protein C0Q70_00649 [Pomacea canaliculata]|uniref:Uncharacterized protein n=1 Tax=Pomacea canaliculata TaxID=400727 RepID=A0A2T7PXA3_POMCA|nr:hypothetical protein C0Q70_00649 [Pomacea canaliculata]
MNHKITTEKSELWNTTADTRLTLHISSWSVAGAVTGVNSREHPPPPCQQRGIALQEARNRRHTTATCGDIVSQGGGKDQEPALRQKGNHAQTHYLIKWESDTLTSGDNEQHPYFLLKDHCGSFQFFQPTVLNLSLFRTLHFVSFGR